MRKKDGTKTLVRRGEKERGKSTKHEEAQVKSVCGAKWRSFGRLGDKSQALKEKRRKQGRIHRYPSRVWVGRSIAGEGH